MTTDQGLASFPCINPEEFAEACSKIEERCHDRLSGSGWHRVLWDFEGLQIRKTINVPINTPQNIEGVAGHEKVMLEEDEDTCLFVRADSGATQSTSFCVDFTILLSPTYGVPVLWFTLPDLPPDAVTKIDSIYRYLVPKSAEQLVKDVGVMGGISIANHPQTDLPAYFIHPCNTHGALNPFVDIATSPEQYLQIWLGLVGPFVGLHLPSQLLSS